MAKVICIATPLYAPQIGGPATHVALLERFLSKEDFSLHVVSFSSVIRLPKILRHFVYFFKVLRQARVASFVYALDPVSVGLPALLAARLAGKPLVLRVGGDYAWEQGVQRFGVTETLDAFVKNRQPSMRVRILQDIESYVARKSVVVVAPSEYLAGVIRTWGIPAKRIVVIYSQPEVAATPLSRSEARKNLGIHEDELMVLSAGRLVPWKGYEGLVDAVALIQKNHPVRLNIAGGGPDREKILKHVASKNAEGFVSLVGQLPQSDLRVWLAAADVFALNTKYEGLSHLLLEAFALSVPVVTTSVGGNSELIENEKTGLLVSPDDIQGLSGAIERCLVDREFSAALSRNAHASLSRFNPGIAIEKLSALFKAI